MTIHTMNYYVAGKNSGLCILTLKDLQEILFREKQVARKYVSRDATYIKINNKYYLVFVYTHRMVYSI